MPLLTPQDPLPAEPHRVVVTGTSGSGKSTLARRIAVMLELPYTELDGLFHGPGWVPRPSFLEDVDRFTSAPRWVTEFQYDVARPILAERADLMVWLDFPRRVVMARIIRRTLRRRWRRTPLWNGEREAPLHTFLTDREHVVRWAWTTHRGTAERVEALLRTRPDLAVVRLRNPGDVATWCGRLSGTDAGTPERPR